MKLVHGLCIPAICILVFSCASFRKGQIASYNGKAFEYTSHSKKNIALIVDAQLIDNGTEVPEKYIKDLYIKHCLNATINAYNYQGFFSNVEIAGIEKEKPVRADLIAEISIHVEKNHNVFIGLLSFISLSILPYKEFIKISVWTSIHDESHKWLKTYERTEAVTTWNQLLMVFVAPFTKMNEFLDEGAVYSEIVYDANMDILRQAHVDGIF